MKPLIVRVIPVEWLRAVKRKLIAGGVARAEKITFIPADRYSLAQGVNLIGYIKGEIGLGQGCRLLAEALTCAGLNFTVYNFELDPAIRYSDCSWEGKITNTLPYNVNIIHLNPYEMKMLYLQTGRSLWDRRYNIAFWLWELEELPADWRSMVHFVDEVWAPSEFICAAVRRATEKPVVKIPYPISAPVDPRYDRAYFGLPDNIFIILCMYDGKSTEGRKNPLGAVKAYKKAFPPDCASVGFVIKINNPEAKAVQVLRDELQDYDKIYIIDKTLDKLMVNSLILACDAYISLHRAEGFGLILAEAMLLGVPCITTNWSSNTEFMPAGTACLVDYELITIEEDIGLYQAGQRWADPDVDQAAGFLQKLRSDKDYYRQIAEEGKKYIAENLNHERIAGVINRRLNEHIAMGLIK
jgi:glycosyltransferase involved in cell wall biosynthesis